MMTLSIQLEIVAGIKRKTWLILIVNDLKNSLKLCPFNSLYSYSVIVALKEQYVDILVSFMSNQGTVCVKVHYALFVNSILERCYRVRFNKE